MTSRVRAPLTVSRVLDPFVSRGEWLHLMASRVLNPFAVSRVLGLLAVSACEYFAGCQQPPLIATQKSQAQPLQAASLASSGLAPECLAALCLYFTLVETLDVLFPGLESLLALLTVAVFLIVVPTAAWHVP